MTLLDCQISLFGILCGSCSYGMIALTVSLAVASGGAPFWLRLKDFAGKGLFRIQVFSMLMSPKCCFSRAVRLATFHFPSAVEDS